MIREKSNSGEKRTNGWPLGSTLGPWSEWQDTISTSSGRCFSKAAISGALQEVCPPTIAPSFVAVNGWELLVSSLRLWPTLHRPLTRSIGSDNSIYKFRLDTVDDIVTQPRDKMAVDKYSDIFGVSRMSTEVHQLQGDIPDFRVPTCKFLFHGFKIVRAVAGVDSSHQVISAICQ